MIGGGDFIILVIRGLFMFFVGLTMVMMGNGMLTFPTSSFGERSIGVVVLGVGCWMLWRFTRATYRILVKHPIGSDGGR